MAARVALQRLRGSRTKTEVAETLGITRQMLGAIERGERTPSLSLAKSIADYYGRSVDELFFGDARHMQSLSDDLRTGTEGR